MYPALAVLKALRAQDESISASDEVASPGHSGQHEVVWIGGEKGIEIDLLSREDLTFEIIPAAGVHGVGIRALPGNLWKLFKGFFAARRIIKDFQPQVLFLTGGYLAVPVAVAGWLASRTQQRSLAVYVPDIEPGLALRVAARLSDQILVTVEESMEYFNDQTNLIVTGYPTRLDLTAIPRDEAIAHFMLSPELPTLLVFGGSKGARSINQAILSILPELLKDLQVIHISGNLDWPTVKEVSNKLPGNIKDRYHSFPYLYKDMGAALNSADLVVSRAGAAVLGEFPLYGVPAILVPYPHAWRYQEINAHYLESRGAAIVMQDHELGMHLYSTITRLINDPQMLKEMSQAMSSLATPQAAESIANILQDLVHSPSSGRI